MRRTRLAGFTLIEMTIVIALIGVVAAALTPMIAGMFASYSDQRRFADKDEQARLALERMLRDLRTVRAPADLSGGGASITFTDIDNAVTTYSLAGTQLLRNGDVLATGVSGLAFSYYDRRGAAVAGAAIPYYIRVQFSLTTDTGVASAHAGEVHPRNFL